MKRFVLLGALSALILGSVGAQEASDDFAALASGPSDAATADTASQAPAGTLKWSGTQTLEAAWADPRTWDGLPEADTSFSGGLSAEWKAGDLKVAGGAEFDHDTLRPTETVVSWAPGNLRFTAGLTEFSWGVADKKNPTDTLNARDYRFGPNADRLVNPAVSAAWYPADWVSFEAVYEPWKEDTQFPKDFRAEVAAGFAAQKAALTGVLGPNLTVLAGTGAAGATAAGQIQTALTAFHTEVTSETLERDGQTPVAAARANFFLPGADLAFSYAYDVDPYLTPVVRLKGTTVPLTVLTGNAAHAGTLVTMWLPEAVDLVHTRIHRFGLNAKTTVDRYGLWLETAYNLGEDPAGTDDGKRNDTLSWTTGLDFNFGPASAYYLNVQYAGEYVFGYDDSTVADYASGAVDLTDRAAVLRQAQRSLTQTLGSQSEQLMHTLTANLKFPLADATVTPQLTGALIVPQGYDDTLVHRYASAYLTPEVEVAPADGVHLTAGARLAYAWVKLAGSDEVTLDQSADKLGLYTPQNQVYVKVSYQWNASK